MNLTAHQQTAFDQLQGFLLEDDYQMAVLEGFAGVGKTFLMGAFLQWAKSRTSVCVAAPTHKALKVICSTLESNAVSIDGDDEEVLDLSGGMFALAQRKQNKNGLNAATIHSLLALRLVEKENGEAECQRDMSKMPSLSEYGLVVIDESSLISRAMFELICTHKNGAKILFVGDPAQLPPIDDNGVISPVFTHVELKVRLSEIVRQASGNPIIKLSMAIRNQTQRFSPMDFMRELPPLPAAAACVSGDKGTLIHYAAAEQKEGRDARVLCYRNQAVTEVNHHVHEILHPGTVFAPGETVLCYFSAGADGSRSPFADSHGRQYKARLMDEFDVIDCTSHPDDNNLPVLKLTLKTLSGVIVTTLIPNDRIGYQRAINDVWSEYRAVNTAFLNAQGEEKERLKQEKSKLSRKAYGLRNRYPDIRHAYAMTVHRSQGSTFDTALVHYQDINLMRSSFDFNRALYVACTRPRQYLAVVV